jgi:hypothetical protein
LAISQIFILIPRNKKWTHPIENTGGLGEQDMSNTQHHSVGENVQESQYLSASDKNLSQSFVGQHV